MRRPGRDCGPVVTRPHRTVICTWSRRRDSNPEPAVYKTAALPIELRRRAQGYRRRTLRRRGMIRSARRDGSSAAEGRQPAGPPGDVAGARARLAGGDRRCVGLERPASRRPASLPAGAAVGRLARRRSSPRSLPAAFAAWRRSAVARVRRWPSVGACGGFAVGLRPSAFAARGSRLRSGLAARLVAGSAAASRPAPRPAARRFAARWRLGRRSRRRRSATPPAASVGGRRRRRPASRPARRRVGGSAAARLAGRRRRRRSLGDRLEQQDRAGDRGVQRADRAAHRDPDDEVARGAGRPATRPWPSLPTTIASGPRRSASRAVSGASASAPTIRRPRTWRSASAPGRSSTGHEQQVLDGARRGLDRGRASAAPGGGSGR